ncbi:MAG: hypothetical protein OEV94_08380 [Deltaproteobacteria bacterium]|nr:hypothetical protein [Deltaproteobacteria bacterium]
MKLKLFRKRLNNDLPSDLDHVAHEVARHPLRILWEAHKTRWREQPRFRWGVTGGVSVAALALAGSLVFFINPPVAAPPCDLPEGQKLVERVLYNQMVFEYGRQAAAEYTVSLENPTDGGTDGMTRHCRVQVRISNPKESGVSAVAFTLKKRTNGQVEVEVTGAP